MPDYYPRFVYGVVFYIQSCRMGFYTKQKSQTIHTALKTRFIVSISLWFKCKKQRLKIKKRKFCLFFSQTSLFMQIYF